MGNLKLFDRFIKLLGLDLDFDIDVQMGRNAFDAVTDTAYVGRRPRSDDLPQLNDVGITHVVSCLPSPERSKMAFLNRDFQTLFLPLRDGVNTDIAATFQEFFDFADGAHKLYIHCEVGVSRSATLATAMVMRSNRQTFFDAYTAVRSRRPEVLPNIGFASQLQRFEHELLGEERAAGEPSSLARYLRRFCNAPVDVDLLEEVLERHEYQAVHALQAIFGNEIPRVVQGVRL